MENFENLTANEFSSTPDIKKGYSYLVQLDNGLIVKAFYNSHGECIINGEDITDRIKIIFTSKVEEKQFKSERDRIFSELFDVLPKDDKGDIELGDEIWHIIYNKEMPKQIK